MKRSDLYEKKTYSREELTSGNWIASRGFDVFEKAEEYRNAVIERLFRASGALQAAGIPYAVVGGNGVATWVASIDPAATRSTKDVDILLKREDLNAAVKALESVGFIYRHVAGLDFFIDGPEGSVRTGVHLLFAGELVLPDHVLPAPDMSEIEMSKRGFYVTTLEAMVRMKLTSHRLKDRVHIQDMIGVGLIDRSWLEVYSGELADRLRHLLDNPEE